MLKINQPNNKLAQSAGAVEYTDCFSAKVKDTPNECPNYDTKQSDGEVFVMLDLCGVQSTPLLSSHQGPHWPGVVALIGSYQWVK